MVRAGHADKLPELEQTLVLLHLAVPRPAAGPCYGPELALATCCRPDWLHERTPDELRSIDLFDVMTDQQLSELLAGSTEISLQPGLELFREGEHADSLVGAPRRRRSTWSAASAAEETVVARMDRPGAAGQAGSVPGMTKASTLPPAVGRRPGGYSRYLAEEVARADRGP